MTRRARLMAIASAMVGLTIGITSLDRSAWATVSPQGSRKATWVARLSARGLNPSDPNLASRLRQLAEAEIASFAHQAFGLTKTSLPGLTTESLGGLSQTAVTSQQGTGSPQKPTTLTKLNKSILAVGAPQIIWGPSVGGAGPGMGHVDGYNLIPADKNITATVDLGSCGKISGHGLTWIGPQPTAPLQRVWLRFPSVAVDAEPVTLVVTVDNIPSNAFPTSYHPAYYGAWGGTVTIQATSPHLASDNLYDPFKGGTPSMALVDGTSIVFSPAGDRVSYNPTGTGGAGDDVIGYGVFLANNYVIWGQPEIKSAQSYMDPPGYTAPADANRGATITQQPANGRLETRVHWYYAPGESISYTLRYGFNKGPYGKRPITSAPKISTCTGEQ